MAVAEENAVPESGHKGGGFMAKLRANFEKHKNLYAIGLAVAGLALTWYIYKHSPAGSTTTTNQTDTTGTAAPTVPAPTLNTPVGSTGGGGGTVPPTSTGGGGGGGSIPTIPSGPSSSASTTAGHGIIIQPPLRLPYAIPAAPGPDTLSAIPAAPGPFTLSAIPRQLSSLMKSASLPGGPLGQNVFASIFPHSVGSGLGHGYGGGSQSSNLGQSVLGGQKPTTHMPLTTFGGSLTPVKAAPGSKVLHPTTVAAVSKTITPIAKAAPVVTRPTPAPVVHHAVSKAPVVHRTVHPVTRSRTPAPAPIVHRVSKPPAVQVAPLAHRLR